MLGEPLDLFGYASGDCGIKAGKILKRLRGKLDVIDQARFSLFFTSSNGIRSEEPRDDWSCAWISPASSSLLRIRHRITFTSYAVVLCCWYGDSVDKEA